MDEDNITILQAFEWYSPPGLWKRLRERLPTFKSMGIDHLWVPPGSKASNAQSNGYDLYDLYDLGEFDWKGSRAIKWGTKEELMGLSKAAKEIGIGLIWDAVLGVSMEPLPVFVVGLLVLWANLGCCFGRLERC